LRRVKKVIFDKTGTLTPERPMLENPQALAALDDPETLALARMTRGSLHPVSRSLLEGLGLRGQKLLAEHGQGAPREHPGCGVTLDDGTTLWSLGKAGWTGAPAVDDGDVGSSTELRQNGALRATFHFRESLRAGAAAVLQWLDRRGLALHILSGDHPEKVRLMAELLDLPAQRAHGGLSPEDKALRVKAIDRHDTLYLGDGANDSLAFDAALVTGTPVVDRSLLESKADFYTLGSGLGFLPGLLGMAAARARAVRAVFGFAVIYNVTTVAFSMAGHMSPLIAAILMPLSSVFSIVIVATLCRGKFTEQ
jgi:Cu2+-exporting ATPase